MLEIKKKINTEADTFIKIKIADFFKKTQK